MLDKNDLALMQDLLDTQTARMMDAMEAQKKEILQETAAATRVLIESSIMPKFNLLAEGQQTLLETLAPKNRVEELEEEVDFLKSIIKLLAFTTFLKCITISLIAFLALLANIKLTLQLIFREPASFLMIVCFKFFHID